MKAWMSRYSAYGMVGAGLILLVMGAAGLARLIWPAEALSSAAELGGGDGFVPIEVPVSSLERAPGLDRPTVSPIAAAGTAPQEDDAEVRALAATQRAHVSEVPVHLRIPSVGLDAPVQPATARKVWMAAQQYEQWTAPDEFAAGWHADSARLGEPGNTVLNGHHNVSGKVFERLVDVAVGERIVVVGDKGGEFTYLVVNKMILPEKGASPEERLENARWIMPSTDERLTLVTCWPADSNTHRLILVASPLN